MGVRELGRAAGQFPAGTGTAVPREADESWPFSQGQRGAVGATRPVLLPAALGHDRQAQAASPSSSPVFLTLHQLQVGHGLALGQKC